MISEGSEIVPYSPTDSSGEAYTEILRPAGLGLRHL
jgi:hypothetical protein